MWIGGDSSRANIIFLFFFKLKVCINTCKEELRIGYFIVNLDMI